jgi:hypothetical protein
MGSEKYPGSEETLGSFDLPAAPLGYRLVSEDGNIEPLFGNRDNGFASADNTWTANANVEENDIILVYTQGTASITSITDATLTWSQAFEVNSAATGLWHAVWWAVVPSGFVATATHNLTLNSVGDGSWMFVRLRDVDMVSPIIQTVDEETASGNSLTVNLAAFERSTNSAISFLGGDSATVTSNYATFDIASGGQTDYQLWSDGEADLSLSFSITGAFHDVVFELRPI